MNKLMPMMGEQTELTMSSLDIAELCEKRHDHVMRDIRRMFEQLGNAPKYGAVEYQDAKGEQRPMYLLDYEQTMCLVSGYEVKLRMAIIKRWRELEAGNSFRIPQSLPEALRLAAEQAEQLERQKALIEQQRPAVEFAKQIASADKGVKLGNYAKTVGIGPQKIFGLLRDMRILMTGGERHNLPYQEFIDRGYFSVRQTSYETNEERRIGHTPLITGKGEEWLTKRLLDAGVLKARAS